VTEKCANLVCNTAFRYFRTGKIYLIDMTAFEWRLWSVKLGARKEYFWLCGECSATMQVTINGTEAVVVECLDDQRGPIQPLAPGPTREPTGPRAASP